jgi:adenylate cyclase
MSEGTKRRLAAIVAADVVGYSRLMGADETGTLATLRAHRSELIDPLIEKHGGRIVKTTGDGLLLEFPSVIAAVEFAIAAQEGIVARNEGVPDLEAMRFRIGVHVGDVIIEGEDLFGNGVNIAARIEPLAEPDGISLSDDAYRQVRDRLDVIWEDGGEHEVKNIARPIQVWHWLRNGQQSPTQQSIESEPLELPDKPSIAVLPFDNMSGDPEQEFFADGMTEDLITDLSKISGMFVVARNSSFVFKGQPIDVRDAARQLGVRYVLEGSVRKAGSRVRINVQLIDAVSGGHLWAERYDGTVENVFELQDDVGAKVVAALAVRLQGDENARLQRVHTHNLNAYELYVRAKSTPYPPIPERIEAAREMSNRLSKRIRISPAAMPGSHGCSGGVRCSGILTLVKPPSGPRRWPARRSKSMTALAGLTWRSAWRCCCKAGMKKRLPRSMEPSPASRTTLTHMFTGGLSWLLPANRNSVSNRSSGRCVSIHSSSTGPISMSTVSSRLWRKNMTAPCSPSKKTSLGTARSGRRYWPG